MTALEKRIAELENTVARLSAKEAIRELRYTYWYSIADKDVDRLVDCFGDEAELHYGFGITLKGKAEIRPFFENLLGNPELRIQLPRGSNPLITLVDANTAKARWLVDVASMTEGAPSRRIAVEYTEHYRREAEGWKIVKMKNDYKFFERPALETEMK